MRRSIPTGARSSGKGRRTRASDSRWTTMPASTPAVYLTSSPIRLCATFVHRATTCLTNSSDRMRLASTVDPDESHPLVLRGLIKVAMEEAILRHPLVLRGLIKIATEEAILRHPLVLRGLIKIATEE